MWGRGSKEEERRVGMGWRDSGGGVRGGLGRSAEMGGSGSAERGSERERGVGGWEPQGGWMQRWEAWGDRAQRWGFGVEADIVPFPCALPPAEPPGTHCASPPPSPRWPRAPRARSPPTTAQLHRPRWSEGWGDGVQPSWAAPSPGGHSPQPSTMWHCAALRAPTLWPPNPHPMAPNATAPQPPPHGPQPQSQSPQPCSPSSSPTPPAPQPYRPCSTAPVS